MGVAYFIVLEREIPGLDSSVSGKLVARASKALEKAARARGVVPLEEFFSTSPEDSYELLADLAADAPETGLPGREDFVAQMPPEQWFDAGAGVRTLRALRAYLVENPQAVRRAEDVAEDLADFERVLVEAHKHGVRWHLEVDF